MHLFGYGYAVYVLISCGQTDLNANLFWKFFGVGCMLHEHPVFTAQPLATESTVISTCFQCVFLGFFFEAYSKNLRNSTNENWMIRDHAQWKLNGFEKSFLNQAVALYLSDNLVHWRNNHHCQLGGPSCCELRQTQRCCVSTLNSWVLGTLWTFLPAFF